MSESLMEAAFIGRLRESPEDFQVFEQLGFEPDGGGEHLWLHIRKTGWNTMDVAMVLAKAARLPVRAVGYSGLKDRHAVTEQWFSLHLPGKPDPDLTDLPEGITLLRSSRHFRKLNRGTHRSNDFCLRVRGLEGPLDELPEILAGIAARGVPNYFGEQRFGKADSNFERARLWLVAQGEAPRKPALRSLWLSAVRSRLFNEVLAERQRRGCWDQLLEGDILQPDQRRGLFFAADEPLAAERINAGEVHPTAPLPGAGGMQPTSACAALESEVLQPYSDLMTALAREGVEAARRATRLPVTAFHWQQDGDTLELRFTLPAGAFATSVLAVFLNWSYGAGSNTNDRGMACG